MAPPKPGSRSRKYCFTWNNKAVSDLQKVYDENKEKIKYIIAGNEVAPTTGTPHVQGYLELVRITAMSTIQKWFNNSVALIRANGSAEENRVYCSKNRDYVEYGTPDHPGERTDIAELYEACKNAKNETEIADKYTKQYFQYHNVIGKIIQRSLEEKAPAQRAVQVYVYWGNTGTGKTTLAQKRAGDDVYLKTAPYDEWWQGYKGQKSIILDEYNSDFKITTLMKICDGTKWFTNIKHAGGWANWDKVFITSNIDPAEWHKKAKPEHRAALADRFTEVRHFSGPSYRAKKAPTVYIEHDPIKEAAKDFLEESDEEPEDKQSTPPPVLAPPAPVHDFTFIDDNIVVPPDFRFEIPPIEEPEVPVAPPQKKRRLSIKKPEEKQQLKMCYCEGNYVCMICTFDQNNNL